MLRHTTPFVLALLLGLLTGCADSHEKASVDALEAMEECVELLKTVKDEDSAQAAAADLDRVANELYTIGERMRELGEMSPERDAELMEKHGDRYNAVMKGFRMESNRIDALGPGIRQVLDDAFDKLNSSRNVSRP